MITTTGAVPQEAMHSTVERLKRPSAVVSPGAMPSFFDRWSMIRSAPRSEQDTLRQAWMCQRPIGLAPELPVEAQHLLDLDARHAEVLDQAVDVAVGDVAAVFLDAAQARQHERGLEAGREARAQRVEFGNEMLHRSLIVTHRSHSPPIMFTEPNVGMMSASW